MSDQNIQTPGRLLAGAREACGLSIEDICKNTRLTPEAVTDLEEDRYERFGAPAFVRGHLRSYARLVKVPESTILDVLEASGLMPALPIAKPAQVVKSAPILNVTRQRVKSHHKRTLLTGALGLLLIIALIKWQSDQTGGDFDKTITAANNSGLSLALPAAQPKVVTAAATPATASQQAATPTTTAPTVVVAQTAHPKKMAQKAPSKKTMVAVNKSNGFIEFKEPPTSKTTYTVTPVS